MFWNAKTSFLVIFFVCLFAGIAWRILISPFQWAAEGARGDRPRGDARPPKGGSGVPRQ
jgi:hypothetical protein